MVIQYCDKCGMRVSEADLQHGRAVAHGETVTCEKCRPATTPVSSPSTQSVPTAPRNPGRRGTSVAPAAVRNTVARQNASSQPETSPKHLPLIIAGLAAALLLIVLYFIMRPAANPPTPRQAASEIKSPPPQPAKAGPARGNTEVAAAKTIASPAGEPDAAEESKRQEAAADKAYDELIRFRGLETEDKSGRITRLEAYIREHGATIASMRARRMLNELKQPASTSKPAATPATAVVTGALKPPDGLPADFARAYKEDFETGALGWSNAFAERVADPTAGGRGHVLKLKIDAGNLRGRLMNGDFPAGTPQLRHGAVLLVQPGLRLKLKYFCKGTQALSLQLRLTGVTGAFSHKSNEPAQDTWASLDLAVDDFKPAEGFNGTLSGGMLIDLNVWGYGVTAMSEVLVDDVEFYPPTALAPQAAAAGEQEDMVKAAVEKLKALNPGYKGEYKLGVNDDKLPSLTLPGAQLSRIDPLADLKFLGGLDLGANYTAKGYINDLGPLQSLKLTSLNLTYQHQLKKVDALAGMPLKTLVLSGTHVSDLAPLAGMPLITLNVSTTQVVNLEPLRGLPLQNLSIANTNVTSLVGLQGLPLTHLTIGYTPVKDLSPLKGLKLKHLAFSHHGIRDFSALQELPIETLSLSATSLQDLTVVKNMPLTNLTINRTKVTDLSPLRGKELKTLRMDECKIDDLSPLKDLPLNTIQLDLDPARHADALTAIKTLKWVNGKKIEEALAKP